MSANYRFTCAAACHLSYRISSRVHILVGEQPRALKSLLVARVLKGEHAHKGEHPVAVPARDELPSHALPALRPERLVLVYGPVQLKHKFF